MEVFPMRHPATCSVLCLLPILLLAPGAAGQVSRDLRQDAAVTALIFSPDGKTLFSAGDDRTVRVWELLTGTVLQQLRGHEATVTSLAHSADGKVLASGGRDGSICLWDPRTGKLLRRCTGHRRNVLALSFSLDGRFLVSASYDRTLRIWDVASARMLAQVEAHADAVSCVSFSPDGQTLASGGHDAMVRIWNVSADGKTIRPVHHLRDAGRSEVTGLSFCMGGRLLASVTTYSTIRMRDPVRGEILRLANFPYGSVLVLAASADGRTLAAAGLGGRLGLCEVATGGIVANKEEPATRTNDLQFSPTEGFPGQVRSLALSTTGFTVAAGTKDGEILVRDIGKALAGRSPPPSLSEKQLSTLWGDLRNQSASDGYRAIALLAARPESSIPFLQQHVTPIARADRARMVKLIDDLDHDRFARREKAVVELEKILDMAEPLLRQRLTSQPSLELRRRIESLLQPLDELVPPPDRLRSIRAVQALEQIGSVPARGLLEKLSKGCPGAWLTDEAHLALKRLQVRGTP
jgi:hypothetical protein